MKAQSQFIEMFKGDDQVPLGDICNIEKGATITRNDVLPGDIPVVAGGQEPSCYHNVANREAGAITVSASGAYAGYINLWSCPIFASDCNTVISKDAEKTDQTFVYFGLKAMQKQIYGLQKGGAQPHVYGKDLQKFMFPHPSYAKQIEFSKMAKQADKSKFVGFKSQFIEMFYNGKYTVDKLREHIDVIRGVSYKPSDVYETHNENTSIVLRSNNIEGGQINFNDLVYVSTERVSELQLLRVGDIVMCGSNGSKKLVGKAAMLQETPTIRTSFGAFCLGIRCKPTLVPEYLATYFQTSLYRDEIEQLGSGSNILNIKPDHIYDLEVPIPLYDEQMAFVSIVRQADKSKYVAQRSIHAISA